MISAGNDIVSLAAIDVTRTNQHKFYSKILSDSEIPLYNEFSLAQIPFENFVWLLWSIKESAYKFLQRGNPGLLFTPVKFVVTELHIPLGYSVPVFNLPAIESAGFDGVSAIKSIITFADYTLSACSVLFGEFIQTVANSDDDFENILWGVQKIDSEDSDVQSAEVRSFLLERVKNVYGDGFRVEKNESGCPVLSDARTNSKIPLSLSHHGRFVGYSFSNNQSNSL